jgi:hypothetical protein
MISPRDPSTTILSPDWTAARTDPHADDEGDLERPEDDGRVRRLAAALGCETDEAGPGQVQGVDRREDGTDSDRAGGRRAVRHSRQTEERPQETVTDCLDIRTAFPQVRILHAIERPDDRVDHAARPRAPGASSTP